MLNDFVNHYCDMDMIKDLNKILILSLLNLSVENNDQTMKEKIEVPGRMMKLGMFYWYLKRVGTFSFVCLVKNFTVIL